MAKGSNSLTGRRASSHNAKPYDANNSFVKKVATKVTDLIPQRSWISKWFNSSQDNGDILNEEEKPEDVEGDSSDNPRPTKRARIRMDVTHPPGTFSIQLRPKTSISQGDPDKQQYSVHDDTSEDFSEPAAAGPSGMGHLISSTPAVDTAIRDVASQRRSDLNSIVAPNNGTANGTDDNSESSESTSGCSSLIPQMNRQEAPSNVSYSSPFSNRKRFMDDKLTFTNHLQSPRSLFLESSCRDSLSSRRPSFNASVMTNTLDNASPLSSPFYSGNITFGGANAAGLYKRSRSVLSNSNEFQLKVPRRTNVSVKPSNAAGVDSSGMSQTAKKILEALEHFSSPISDAKKIPLKNTNNNVPTPTSKKRSREEMTSPNSRVGLRHLTRELTVPTVPDILKLRRRQKLQDTTVAARRIVSARSEPPRPQEYHLRTQADEDVKHLGKVKAKAKVNLDEEETVTAVNLPNIPLPITSLPNFDFAPPQNPSTKDKNTAIKEETYTFANPIKITNMTKNLKSINNFTFSSPISAESKQSCNSTTDPYSALKVVGTQPTTGNMKNSSSAMQNFMWSGSSTAPRPKEKTSSKDSSVVAASNELKTGSVMDILCPGSGKTETDGPSKPKAKMIVEKDVSGSKGSFAFGAKDSGSEKVASSKIDVLQTSSDVWECSECVIKNSNSVTHCIACKAPKSTQKTNKVSETISVPCTETKPESTPSGCFGTQFKLSDSQWECTSCYVRNKQSDVKCVACSALKPGPKNEAKTNTVKLECPGIFDKLKSAEGAQKCPVCMTGPFAMSCTCKTATQNSANASTAKSNTTADDTDSALSEKPSAQSSTPGTAELMDKFKPSKDTWECPCCMVRNAGSADSCPCCNTARPNLAGTVAKKSSPLPTNGFGDKFKKPKDAWTCDACMLQNDANATQCVACETPKPGATESQSSASNTGIKSTSSFSGTAFKFGIDKSDQGKLTSAIPTNGFKFGESQQGGATKFTFGISKEQKDASSEPVKGENAAPTTSKSPGGSFGFQVAASSIGKSDASQDTKKTPEKPAPLFSFGVPKSKDTPVASEKPAVTTSSATASTLGFSFGMPKPEVKQADTSTEKQLVTSENAKTEVSKPSTEIAAPVTTTPSSVIAPVTQSTVQESKPNSVFVFGMQTSTSAASTTTSTNVMPNSLPSTTSSSFAFPTTKAATVTSTMPTFGQIATSTPSTSLSTTFTFGDNKTAETTTPSLAKTSTTSPSMFSNISNTPTLFGTNETKASATFTPEATKPSTFGTTGSKPSAFVVPESKVPAFGSTETKPPIFGSLDTKVPMFGSTGKPSTVFNPTAQAFSATPAPTFEAPSATPSLFGTSTTTPVFGNNAPSTFGTGTTPSIFSTTKANESSTTNSNLFTFGTTPAQPAAQPQTGGFNFSTNTNPTTSAQKPLFTFGSSANAAQSNNLFGTCTFENPAPSNSTGFTFNAPKPEAPTFGQTAVATPIFGAPQPGAQSQPTPSFSSTPASNAGFNFGSTAPATSTSGFNFGGMGTAPAPPGEFNFNPPNPALTFDPNTRPSFNFTGGSAPLAFNATPQSSAPRKIKKAVRRRR